MCKKLEPVGLWGTTALIGQREGLSWVQLQQRPPPVPQGALEVDGPSELSSVEARGRTFVLPHRRIVITGVLQGGAINLGKAESCNFCRGLR